MNTTHPGELQDRLGMLRSVAHIHVLNGLDRSEWLTATEESDSEESHSRIPVEFDYRWEEEFARALDEHEVSWRYKPRTFAVEWDDEGNFVDSFTPDFYLPESDLYVQLVGPDNREAGPKARKVRLLRAQQPRIRIELLSNVSTLAIQELFLRPWS